MATTDIYSSAERSLKVYIEPDGSFGVDNSANEVAQFLALPIKRDSLTIQKDNQTATYLTAATRAHKLGTPVDSSDSGTISFTTPLHLNGTLAGDATASPDDTTIGIYRLFKSSIGGQYAGTGSDVTVVTSDHEFDLTSIAGFSRGTTSAWINGDSKFEIRETTGAGVSTLENKIEFCSTPSVSDIMYAGTSFYLDDSCTHLQFIYESGNPDDKTVFMGAQLTSLSISYVANEVPEATWTYAFANHTVLGGGTGGSSPDVDVYIMDDATFYLRPLADTDCTPLCVHEFALTLDIRYEPFFCINEARGIGGYRKASTSPVATATFKVYDDYSGYVASQVAGDKFNLAIEAIDGSTGGFLTTLPTCKVAEVTYPQGSGSGFDEITVTLEADLDEGTAGGASSVVPREYSPIRFHFVG